MPTRRRRPARVSAAWLILIGSVAAVAVLTIMLIKGPPGGPQPQQGGTSAQPLFIYCAAGIRPPVEATAGEYEKLFNASFQYQWGPSEGLLSSTKLTHTGDLF